MTVILVCLILGGAALAAAISAIIVVELSAKAAKSLAQWNKRGRDAWERMEWDEKQW